MKRVTLITICAISVASAATFTLAAVGNKVTEAVVSETKMEAAEEETTVTTETVTETETTVSIEDSVFAGGSLIAGAITLEKPPEETTESETTEEETTEEETSEETEDYDDHDDEEETYSTYSRRNDQNDQPTTQRATAAPQPAYTETQAPAPVTEAPTEYVPPTEDVYVEPEPASDDTVQEYSAE